MNKYEVNRVLFRGSHSSKSLSRRAMGSTLCRMSENGEVRLHGAEVCMTRRYVCMNRATA